MHTLLIVLYFAYLELLGNLLDDFLVLLFLLVKALLLSIEQLLIAPLSILQILCCVNCVEGGLCLIPSQWLSYAHEGRLLKRNERKLETQT